MQDAGRAQEAEREVAQSGKPRTDEPAMSAPSPRAEPSGWAAVPLDEDASRRLLQQRVGYFAGVFLLLSMAFYLRNAIAMGIIARAWPPFRHPAFLLHSAAIALHAVEWLLCRSLVGRASGSRALGPRPPVTRPSLRQLYWIDAIGLVGAMALYGGVTVVEAGSLELAVAVQSAGAEVLLVAVIVLALVLTHAIIVPLDVRRMFWLSAAVGLLGVAAAYLVAAVGLPPELLAQKPWLPLNQVIYVGMWALAAVTGATIAARVIHGLQQRVRDANEVGQYVLEERIGEGGMGVVYLARHALLRRPTAIKLLPARRSGEEAVQRFEREVRLTSSLTHPNTISIFDFGRTPDGVFYYAMEYVDGVTLEQLVALDGPQPPARVISLLQQVCGALDEAHAAGLIHRDIKPANLMLCIRGNVPDQIKVLDFGLVKEHDADASQGLSMHGALLGTPAYLAPEAITNPSRADARSDIYSLAAVGYWLLVGDLVFPGQTVVEVCVHHLHTQPVPPAERCAGPVPAELNDLIVRCLAKDPALRPASALELSRLLGAIGAAGSWSREQADTWWTTRAPELLASARTHGGAGSTPGPRTIAVDMEHRTPSSRVRARR